MCIAQFRCCSITIPRNLVLFTCCMLLPSGTSNIVHIPGSGREPKWQKMETQRLKPRHGSTRQGDHLHNYRDAQCTEKSVFYGFWSHVSVYGQKNDLWPNLRIFSRSRYSTEKNTSFGRIYGFLRRRMNLFGCAEWTFSATTRNLRIFWNSDWASPYMSTWQKLNDGVFPTGDTRARCLGMGAVRTTLITRSLTAVPHFHKKKFDRVWRDAPWLKKHTIGENGLM